MLLCCQSSGVKGRRMSPTPTTVPSYGSVGTFRFERRSHQRYPLSLDVEYKLLERKLVQRKGLGRTINISARGVLFGISDLLPILIDLLSSDSVQLVINWPFLLDGSIPLKLLMYGNFVRVRGNTIAVRVTGHAFYTTGDATQQA